MLRKVLKHDFKSVLRHWSIAAVIALCTSVVGALTIRIMSEMPQDSFLASSELFNSLILILVIACMVSLAAFAIVAEILIYVRYYKNFFTDEGYLTFTLPVSRKTLLTSKTLNAVIWTMLNGLVTFGCIMIYLLIGPDLKTLGIMFSDAFKGIGYIIKLLWEGAGWWTVLLSAEGILIAAASLFFSVSQIQTSITIGSTLAKKHKVIASIAAYYVTNYVMSSIASALTYIAGSIAETAKVYETFESMMLFTSLVMLAAFIVIAALGFICHFINLRILERKLNLA